MGARWKNLHKASYEHGNDADFLLLPHFHLIYHWNWQEEDKKVQCRIENALCKSPCIFAGTSHDKCQTKVRLVMARCAKGSPSD